MIFDSLLMILFMESYNDFWNANAIIVMFLFMMIEAREIINSTVGQNPMLVLTPDLLTPDRVLTLSLVFIFSVQVEVEVVLK